MADFFLGIQIEGLLYIFFLSATETFLFLLLISKDLKNGEFQTFNDLILIYMEYLIG
jgi:hypothetical protein